MKKQFCTLAMCLGFISILGGNSVMASNMVKAQIKEDTTSILKNPAMGWALYIDTVGGRIDIGDYIPEAEFYWESVENAVPYVSHLYLRVAWAELEPQKGRYAWIYDSNFKKLIQGARDRGIKLCFSIYYLSKDAAVQATPDYVRQAGAEGHELYNLGGPGVKAWSPYEYDPVFQNAFSIFLTEFAKAFDNPDIVDYIDGVNLGWWGETHWMEKSGDKDTDSNALYTKAQKQQMYDWAVNLYSSKIKHVLLLDHASDFGFDFTYREKALAKNYQMRRCSVGSKWFWPQEKEFVRQNWPKYAFFAENAFHHFYEKWWNNTDAGINGYTIPEMMQAVYDDALASRANSLELRIPVDVDMWLSERPDLVQSFAIKCGYRLSPTDVSYPSSVKAGQSFSVTHSWKNEGVGKLPNNNSAWNGKYKIAFALLDKATGKPVSVGVQSGYELGTLIKENPAVGLSAGISAPSLPGSYYFAVGIVDTQKSNRPDIKLALKNENKNGWYVLGDIKVAGPAITTASSAASVSSGSETLSSKTQTQSAEDGSGSNSRIDSAQVEGGGTVWSAPLLIAGAGAVLISLEAVGIWYFKKRKKERN